MKVTIHVNPIVSFLWFAFFDICNCIIVSSALDSERLTANLWTTLF